MTPSVRQKDWSATADGMPWGVAIAFLAILAGCDELERSIFKGTARDVPPDCTTSAECSDPAKPICNQGQCEPCTNTQQCLSRAGEGASQERGDVCLLQSRGGQGTCGPCLDNSECPSGFCFTTDLQMLFASAPSKPDVLKPGRCIPDAATKYVKYSPDTIACAQADGSSEKPYCQAADALAAQSQQPVLVLRLLSSPAVHPAINVVGGGKTVLLVGAKSTSLDPAVQVERVVVQNAKLVLDGIAIAAPSNTTAAMCDVAAELVIKRSSVAPAPKAMYTDFAIANGIDSSPACNRLVVEQSLIRSFTNIGIRAQAKDVRITNNGVIFINKPDSDPTYGSVFLSGQSGLMAHNTIVNNPAAMACSAGNRIQILNNIIAGNDAQDVTTCGAIAGQNYVRASARNIPFYVADNIRSGELVAKQLRIASDIDVFFGCCINKAMPDSNAVTIDFFGCSRPLAGMNLDYGFHQHNGCSP